MKKLLLAMGIILTLNTSTLMAELTQTQLHATLNIVTNFILDDGIISHNGTSYGKVTSPYTGRVWLDRNLGASKVCTSFDDALCYGDYYQWGRGYDGHQVSSSADIPTLANDVSSVGHGDFITSADDWTAIDSNGSLRAANWSVSDGTSICPSGFRVPTLSELQAETLDNNVNNRATAFSNFLKLPSSGLRDKTLGNMIYEGVRGALWSSSVDGTDIRSIYFYYNTSGKNSIKRANGRSVRCIKNTTPADVVPPVITITDGVTLYILLNGSYSDAGATAIDDTDGNLTVTSVGTVDTSTLGDYTITYTATDSAGNVAKAVRTVSVLNSITHNGVDYGEIISPYTGRIWLDRNLGASQACTSLDDALCYGDYYQWGRAHDGHQVSTSSVSTILAPNGNAAGSSFILNTASPKDWTTTDSSGSLRSSKWSAIDGSSICPVGYKVPTDTELDAELFYTGSAEISDTHDAFNSFLKLPSAGFRSSDNTFYDQDIQGYIWSSTATGSYAIEIILSAAGNSYSTDISRGNGMSMRCMKY